MQFPEEYRAKGLREPFETKPGDRYGVFIIPRIKVGKKTILRSMRVIASDGTLDELDGHPMDIGWEHVSVTLLNMPACPTWEEMCFVKDLFWPDDECVVQFHPPKANYVDIHKTCLHLWKKIGEAFPMPPREAV